MTNNHIVIAAAADFEDDDVQPVTVLGRTLAVYKVDGQFYASDDLCNHGNACLSDGYVEDGKVECPLHGGSFDVRTGLPCKPPVTEPMRTYTVAETDGNVVLLNPSELEG